MGQDLAKGMGGTVHPDTEMDKTAAVFASRSAEFEERPQNVTYVAIKALCEWNALSQLPLRGKSVLNIGCFEPIDEIWFARYVGKWTAIDISPQVIENARRTAERALAPALMERLAFEVQDARRLTYPDASFDIVVSFSVLEHIPDAAERSAAFREAGRVLRPGGHAVIVVPHRRSVFYFAHRRNLREGTGSYGFAHLYTRKELRRELEGAGLKPLTFFSEMEGVRWLPSWLPVRARNALSWLVPLGERIGFVAGKPVPGGAEPGASPRAARPVSGTP